MRVEMICALISKTFILLTGLNLIYLSFSVKKEFPTDLYVVKLLPLYRYFFISGCLVIIRLLLDLFHEFSYNEDFAPFAAILALVLTCVLILITTTWSLYAHIAGDVTKTYLRKHLKNVINMNEESTTWFLQTQPDLQCCEVNDKADLVLSDTELVESCRGSSDKTIPQETSCHLFKCCLNRILMRFYLYITYLSTNILFSLFCTVRYIQII
ncbi:hypothetical protein HZS_6504 [Henneguya salminicola]|nr:hypothetical protein HZS_6504 [Henneguya salminicola]